MRGGGGTVKRGQRGGFSADWAGSRGLRGIVKQKLEGSPEETMKTQAVQ